MTSKGNAALRGVSSTTTWTLHVQQKARIAEENLLSPPSSIFARRRRRCCYYCRPGFVLMVQRTFVGTWQAIRYFIYQMVNQKNREEELKNLFQMICTGWFRNSFDFVPPIWNVMIEDFAFYFLQHCNSPFLLLVLLDMAGN